MAEQIDFLTWQALTDVLHEEASALDEQRWDDWLSLFTDDCIYWIPAWNGEHELAEDPERDVSLIYMDDKAMIEDRLWRFTSGTAPAAIPLPRTSHLVGTVTLESFSGNEATLRSHWQVSAYRFKELTETAGRSYYTLRLEQGQWRIARRRSVLINDQVQTTLDLYHL